MRINNNLDYIKSEINRLNAVKEKLYSLKTEFPKSIDTLYNSGNRDKHFVTLKSSVENSERDLINFIQKLDEKIQTLVQLEQLIGSYYSIQL
jgi:prefoldin subunit 5